MTFGLFNLAILFGLLAVLIPPIIHLLSRRRYDVVDWGAMQFLDIGEAKRRRFLLEEILLLLLRMGLIALVVLALAAPFVAGPWVAEISERPNRDVVLVFDGSSSMQAQAKGKSVFALGKLWAKDFLNELRPGDRVALVYANGQADAVLAKPVENLNVVQKAIDELPPPEGVCHWPRAVTRALDILQTDGEWEQQEIILIGDGQQFGCTDSSSQIHWQQIREHRKAESQEGKTPRLWFVNAWPDVKPSNFSLGAIKTTGNQAFVNQPVRFEFPVSRQDLPRHATPKALKLLVDGKEIRKLHAPAGSGAAGDVTIPFVQQFTEPGEHVVSLVLQPTSETQDVLGADNRRDYIINVQPRLPILLVDGDNALSPTSATAYLRQALQPSPTAPDDGGLVVKSVAWPDFDATLLKQPLIPGENDSTPRVVVFADIAGLSASQNQAVDAFLETGGGVLMILGDNITNPKGFNDSLYQNGKGWLPGKVLRIAGDRNNDKQAASPNHLDLFHPVVAMFRKESSELGRARFPQWWKVAAGTQSTPVARLTTGDPFLLEKSHHDGKVILCTVPLDRSWNSNFAEGVWEYPLLMHELIYYLANPTPRQTNLQPGQPIRYRPTESDEKQTSVTLEGPDLPKMAIPVDAWPFVYTETQTPGIYTVTAGTQAAQFAVQQIPDEFRLTKITAQEQEALTNEVGIQFEADTEAIGRAVLDPDQKMDIWWLLLVGVILFLCLEIWMTRRMVMSRSV